MLRYFAVIWDTRVNREDVVARAIVEKLLRAAPDLRATFATDGLATFCTPRVNGASQAHVLEGGGGVVIGTVFVRDGEGAGARVGPQFPSDAAAGIIRSAGRTLVTDYWGRYVAFLHDRIDGRKRVLRDPSGGLPCLQVVSQGVRIFGSCMDRCLEALPVDYSLNWRYLSARVVDPQIRGTETGISEVTELRPAECMEVAAAGVSRTFYWNPFDIAQNDVVRNPTEAAEALRATARACVQAWASEYPRILAQLSGGLDSTILASCLAGCGSHTDVVCVNDYSKGADTDERTYARLAAARTGFRLVERQRVVDMRLRDRVARVRSAIPVHRIGWVRCTPSDSELAMELNATALFTGRGGDELFYRSRREWPLADYLFDHGPNPTIFALALDVACMDPTSRCMSVWTLLKRASRYGLVFVRKDPFQRSGTYQTRQLVNPDVVARMREDRTWRHPWFEGKRTLGPGKSMHAYRLSFPQPYYEHSSADDLEVVHPLASQPLVELALRIPTYVLMAEGQERVIARRAFARDIPQQIAMRFEKGGIDVHAVDVLRANIAFVREFLLDGILVAQGLLDRKAIMESVGGPRNGIATGTREIFDHVQLEAWARAWRSTC